MRLRVGLLLCLFAVIAVVGCRKPMTPNVDRNKAPETWITAAPFDTITLERGHVPLPGTIPIRFHVYWAGSDQDGAVSGYYWAVVETLRARAGGGVPPLPGPRARLSLHDRAATARSSSTVAEDSPDRLHAFFIYSVRRQGQGPIPTPARLHLQRAGSVPAAADLRRGQRNRDRLLLRRRWSPAFGGEDLLLHRPDHPHRASPGHGSLGQPHSVPIPRPAPGGRECR